MTTKVPSNRPNRPNRPKNTKTIKNGFAYYTYWREAKLKTGKIVFHKKTDIRRLKCVNTKEKNNYLHKVKQTISHSPDFSLEDIKKFHQIIQINPNEFKKWIETKKISSIVT